jgi:hypothetical protein
MRERVCFGSRVWRDSPTWYRGRTGMVVRPPGGTRMVSGEVLVAWSGGHLRVEQRADLRVMRISPEAFGRSRPRAGAKEADVITSKHQSRRGSPINRRCAGESRRA